MPKRGGTLPEAKLQELRANLDAILEQKKKAAPAPKKPASGTRLSDVIYGADKSINFANFDVGKVLHAISFDLEEFGKKGVQGARVEPSCVNFAKQHKTRTDLKAPYLQAGVLNGTLVLLLRDDEANVEAMTVLIKDYVNLKGKLKKSSTSVTNIEPGDDPVMSEDADRVAHRRGTSVRQDPNYGEITGDIVLMAHGKPAAMPSGRLVAEALGEKTPQEIFALLTSSEDPKKRVGKDYNGTLTLSGCFTASGGPEAAKQDDPYAKKVLDLFRDNGYTKISVVGYPGAVMNTIEAGPDSFGTPIEEGEEVVLGRAVTAADLLRSDELEAAATEAINTFNGLIHPSNAALDAFKAAGTALRNRVKDSGLREADYLQTPQGQVGHDEFKRLKATYETAKRELEEARAKMNEAEQALTDSGFADVWARLEGRFGLRTVN